MRTWKERQLYEGQLASLEARTVPSSPVSSPVQRARPGKTAHMTQLHIHKAAM